MEDIGALIDRTRDGTVLVIHVAHARGALGTPALATHGFAALDLAFDDPRAPIVLDPIVPTTIVYRAGVEIDRVWSPVDLVQLIACAARGQRYHDHLGEVIASDPDHFDARCAMACQLGFGQQFANAAEASIWLLRHGPELLRRRLSRDLGRPVGEDSTGAIPAMLAIHIGKVLAYIVARSPGARARVTAESAESRAAWLFLAEVLDDPDRVLARCREELARDRPDPTVVAQLEDWLEDHLLAHVHDERNIVPTPCAMFEELERMMGDDRRDVDVPGHAKRVARRLLHARLSR